ncbi:hypothetical protein E7T09_04630 [Deinococcus sp. KSM4-11]|uniref:hypothetical protein n=1 Tax=Deinococcus sp. KSM4-11 TaxID=2568654 RepID=UPI0010A339B2|nr:hypothetical protein [Deinococcus sp. KSM4-11]THF88497.1 hypothetical protein E7T09_04630 [Deinococcus sp. KSM4-11]
MKKQVVAAVGMMGLTGVLASCGTTAVVVTDPVRNVQILEYTSQYVLPTAYTDTNTGTQYPAGSPVICDNFSTALSATLDWDGDAARFAFQLEGSKGGKATVLTGTSASGNGYSGNPTTFQITVGAGVAPLKVNAAALGAQGIVVDPVNTFTVRGVTFLNIQGQSRDGSVSNVAQSVNGIPVADCTN